MQRYTVTVVDPGSPETRPILAVPFEPSALVSAFIEELFKRIAKQGLKLTPNSHIATLHLDNETGKLPTHALLVAASFCLVRRRPRCMS